jgi:uncharacterized protein (DUF488 family)
MEKTVYTIGHSNHSLSEFVKILIDNEINCLCDVRSTPYSKFTPQFNRESLKEKLKMENILYLEFDKEFGARRTEQSLLTNGVVDFEKVALDPLFKSGILRIQNGLDKCFKIALMCSEKDPIDCHRNILCARNLQKNGVDIVHILYDGKQEENSITEKRLVEKYSDSNDKQKKIQGTSIEIDVDGNFVFTDEGFNSEIFLNMIYKRAEKAIAFRTEEID